MADTILKAINVKKDFVLSKSRKIEAVKGINLEVQAGEIFGFLGPNGAGKSTMISMLTTQSKPTSGEIFINNQQILENSARARKKIGVVAQHNNLDKGLTARENLTYHAKYFGLDDSTANQRADEYLEKFGLKDRQHDYVKSYSGGMAQRLKIARAIIHQPDILFLDEPTTGLDPAYRAILWEQILTLNKAGTTIFLTTHYMEEPEQLCDRIAIVDKGEIQAIGTTEELKELIPANNIISITFSNFSSDIAKQAKELPEVENIVVKEDELLLYVRTAHPNFHQIMEWIKTLDTSLETISLSRSTLEDVFIHLTSKGGTENGRTE